MSADSDQSSVWWKHTHTPSSDMSSDSICSVLLNEMRCLCSIFKASAGRESLWD